MFDVQQSINHGTLRPADLPLLLDPVDRRGDNALWHVDRTDDNEEPVDDQAPGLRGPEQLGDRGER